MFSIGEFARLGTVSVRTLRHYDEIGLLPPAKVDPATGYRGYSAEQLRLLNRIVALKELGLSLAQGRQLMDGITLEELQGMLMLRRAQLEQELEEHRNQLPGPAGDRGSCRRAQRPGRQHLPDGVPRSAQVGRGARLRGHRAGPRDLGQRGGRLRRRRPAGVRDPAAFHPPGDPARVGDQEAGRRAMISLVIASGGWSALTSTKMPRFR